MKPRIHRSLHTEFDNSPVGFSRCVTQRIFLIGHTKITQWKGIGKMNTIKTFFKDETGLELSEYAVAAALIAVAVVTAFTNLGTAITGAINDLKAKIKP